MKIVMLGAGAMGSLFGAMLSRSGKREVWLLDVWEEHVNRIKSHGLVVESEEGEAVFEVMATTNPDEVGVADLIVVFVKAYMTRDAVESALPMVGRETLFLSLQNGLGNVESICSVIPDASVAGGVTSQGSTMLGPGRVRHGGKGNTFVGQVKGSTSPRLERAASLLNDAGIPTKVSNSIERLNEEFRRRVKTQGSLPNVDAGLKLLYGLFAGGLIQLRRVNGWRGLPAVVEKRRREQGLVKQLDKAA